MFQDENVKYLSLIFDTFHLACQTLERTASVQIKFFLKKITMWNHFKANFKWACKLIGDFSWRLPKSSTEKTNHDKVINSTKNPTAL